MTAILALFFLNSADFDYESFRQNKYFSDFDECLNCKAESIRLSYNHVFLLGVVDYLAVAFWCLPSFLCFIVGVKG